MLAETAETLPAAPAPTREQIERYEAYALQLPQVEIQTLHWLHAGQYFRQITIPADTLATGAVHLRDHVSVMVRGDMTVLTDRGMQRVTGYHAWQGLAGQKRVGYAHAETVWLTVHRCDAETVEEAEAELFENAPMLLSNRGKLPFDSAMELAA